MKVISAKFLNDDRRKLGRNTAMLYLLTFSNFLFGFITIPYQTRILGPEYYGLIGLATALTMYFQLILDFGFILSATQRVADNSDDNYRLSKIFTSVTCCKCLLSVLCMLILSIICMYVGDYKKYFGLFLMYLIWAIVTSMLPDYIYRGLQNMQTITYRTVAVKLLFTILIFIFMNKKEEYFLIPLFNIFGAFFALVWSFIDLYSRWSIKFIKVEIRDILEELKASSLFFYSRIASTVSTSMNMILLRSIYGESTVLGYYTSADKIVSIAKAGSSPIADSIYPYMVRNKDFKLVKKILYICMPFILLAGIWLFCNTNMVCSFIFGEEFLETGNILKYMIPIMVIILPTYILGFPTMVPLGLSKQANFSNMFGATIQILGLLICFFSGSLNIISLCILTCISEYATFLYRVICIGLKIKTKNFI